MSLDLELRVNGRLIGTIHAQHTTGCRACTTRARAVRHEYTTEVREICSDNKGRSRTSVVKHTPEFGAWGLIHAILDSHPKGSWK
ncbi:hypothetical protein [Rhodococcus ruber]|uniref:hypothetical protein n=1 Tax=Rhodococcus ruber TaxID=1830 RepID=UPI0037834518